MIFFAGDEYPVTVYRKLPDLCYIEGKMENDTFVCIFNGKEFLQKTDEGYLQLQNPLFIAILFFAIGAFLFWYVYKDIDLKQIGDDLANLKYSWIALSFFFGLLSHFLRAIRWKILLISLGYKPKTANLYFSILILYLTNLIISRGREVVRCRYHYCEKKKLFSS